MAKFAVYAVYTASKYLGEIEADSPDEAKSKAEETYDDTYVSLCHQCSGKLDLNGDAEFEVEQIE